MISVLKNYAHYKSGNVTIITIGQPFEFNCLYMPLDQVTTATETRKDTPRSAGYKMLLISFG